MTTTSIGWPEAQRICDIPEIHEALSTFSHDSTEDNAVGLICAVLNAAATFTQGRAAGLELPLWKVDRVDGVIRAVDENGSEIATGLGREVYAFVKAHNAAIRALSPTPSDAGKDDALLTIARDALEEIALAGMSGSGQESEDGMRDWHARRAWEFIGIAARAKTAIDAALSSLEVIGKGEKG